MNAKAWAGVLIALGFLGLYAAALLPAAVTTTPGPGVGIGVALWDTRMFEVLVQGLILLGGVVSILLLLESQARKEVPR